MRTFSSPFRWLSVLILAVTSAASPAAEEVPASVKTRLPIGMNLAGISNYSLGFPFKNLMWGARPWTSQNQSGGGDFSTGLADQIPLDGNGYPLELPYKPAGAAEAQIVLTIIPNVTEPGRYIVLYKGEG